MYSRFLKVFNHVDWAENKKLPTGFKTGRQPFMAVGRNMQPYYASIPINLTLL